MTAIWIKVTATRKVKNMQGNRDQQYNVKTESGTKQTLASATVDLAAACPGGLGEGGGGGSNCRSSSSLPRRMRRRRRRRREQL